uniref:RING-type domain-containing protein n=1 Tax=Caenorhabditis tropicalis TaxID=1561998 RepID=A0A1I7U033_9PELO
MARSSLAIPIVPKKPSWKISKTGKTAKQRPSTSANSNRRAKSTVLPKETAEEIKKLKAKLSEVNIQVYEKKEEIFKLVENCSLETQNMNKELNGLLNLEKEHKRIVDLKNQTEKMDESIKHYNILKGIQDEIKDLNKMKFKYIQICREETFDESWLKCEFCRLFFGSEKPRTPRVLGCGHTMCFSCAENRVKDDNLTCRIDGEITKVNGAALEEAIPINFTVATMCGI